MSKVLVTGGAGFIGSNLTDLLLKQGVSVVCLDSFDEYYDEAVKRRNLESAIANPEFTLIEGDIRDEELVEKVFASHRISSVVHLAARAGVRPSIQQPLLYQDVNIRGTNILLEAVRRYPVKRFVFASSSSVYGGNTKVPFSEDDRVDSPVSPYAATKKAGELLCHTYHHLYQIPIICLRFFTVFGPRQRPDLAIHKFTRLMLQDQEIPVFGDGSTGRDYTFVEDILQGIQASLECDYPFEIFNLGNSRPVLLSELIKALESAIGKKAMIRRMPVQPGDMELTCADISKSQRMLGYKPQVSLEEGLRRFVAWYKKQNSL